MRTWAALPRKWQVQTHVVVPKGEERAYSAYPVLVCPRKGIGPTRQWIMERHTTGVVLMLDDDLEFFARRDDDATKMRKAVSSDVNMMLASIRDSLFAHGGVPTREGSNRNTAEEIYNSRCLRALFYDARAFHHYKLRFDRVPVMEDFDVALQFLRQGCESVQYNNWTQDQPGSNTAGGCSTYRTAEIQAAGARGLAKLHPKFVTVVEKPPLKSGGWNGQPRTDVKIAWKKALESARV
jgi:hypothetical protein